MESLMIVQKTRENNECNIKEAEISLESEAINFS